MIFTALHRIHWLYVHLLYEYRDLFIDMDVGNNCSELAIANQHQQQ